MLNFLKVSLLGKGLTLFADRHTQTYQSKDYKEMIFIFEHIYQQSTFPLNSDGHASSTTKKSVFA